MLNIKRVIYKTCIAELLQLVIDMLTHRLLTRKRSDSSYLKKTFEKAQSDKKKLRKNAIFLIHKAQML